MTKKYLEVDITKTLTTTLYVCVDDEDPRFNGFFNKQGLDKISAFNQVAKNLPIAKAVSETVYDSDWEFAWNPNDSNYDVTGIDEVDQEEAETYIVFDVESSKIKELE